jgi:regulator of protease activity HflC (stomatin/prohibitin superfamily)
MSVTVKFTFQSRKIQPLQKLTKTEVNKVSQILKPFNDENAMLKTKKITRTVVIALIGLFIFINCTTIVPAGHTGVPVTLGAVNEHVTFAEGFRFKAPFVTTVVKMDNRVKRVEAEAGSASKDLQNVTSRVSVNYRIINATSATLYKTVGLGVEDVIIKPAIQECVKAITARYTAEELITKRQIVSTEMQELLMAKVNPFGISIEIFNITDFNFSAEFNSAIERKQVAQQAVQEQQQQLEKERILAQQAITKAEGEAQSREEQAKGEAAAIVAKADAEAYAIEVIQRQLAQTPQYIEYLRITQWDGVLPEVVSDGNMLIGWNN